MEYNPSGIEKKWRQYWKDEEVYKVSNDSDQPKYYVLDMFPYPSGSGLHVGHPLGYIASDIHHVPRWAGAARPDSKGCRLADGNRLRTGRVGHARMRSARLRSLPGSRRIPSRNGRA